MYLSSCWKIYVQIEPNGLIFQMLYDVYLLHTSLSPNITRMAKMMQYTKTQHETKKKMKKTTINDISSLWCPFQHFIVNLTMTKHISSFFLPFLKDHFVFPLVYSWRCLILECDIMDEPQNTLTLKNFSTVQKCKIWY